jgi:hypothetical protein
MSKARLKVGAYTNNIQKSEFNKLAKIYDVMLRTESNHNQKDFLDNTYEYLTILSPKKNV